MIYLIAGIAKSGKTYVAKQMTAQTGFGYFSTDYLMMSLFRASPESGVHPDDPDEVVAKAMEPFLHGMIRAMVENRVDYIFEGVHFTPEFVHRLQTDFPGAVHAVFLGYKKATVEGKLEELRKYSRLLENDWMREWTPAQRTETLRFLILDSELLAGNAAKFGYPYFEIEDIARQTDGIIAQLLGLGSEK